MSCQSFASAFLQSYASAMHLAQSPTTTPSSCATALGKHYLPGMMEFTYGNQHSFTTTDDAITAITSHLEKFERAGWGYDIRLDKSRVESVSAGSALCWATWKIYPKNGVEGWSWKNVYGYRKTQDGKEGWEFSMCDNEVEGIVKRAPRFFEG